MRFPEKVADTIVKIRAKLIVQKYLSSLELYILKTDHMAYKITITDSSSFSV